MAVINVTVFRTDVDSYNCIKGPVCNCFGGSIAIGQNTIRIYT